MDDLKTILDRIKKPLSFAARDEFAHIKSLAAMEAFIKAQVENLKRIVKDSHEIAEIEHLFAGFDSLSQENKKDRIIKAVAVIDAFGQTEKAAVDTPSRPPKEAPPHPGTLPPGESAKQFPFIKDRRPS